MPKIPSISVIIPTLNRPEDLRRALISLALQTDPAEEILVIDQSADDKTKNVVAEMKEKYPSVLDGLSYCYFKERSSAKARNHGIRIARGDILSFLDDDIELFPNYFEKVRNYFVKETSLGGLSGDTLVKEKCAGIKWELRKLLLRFFLLSFWDGKMTPSGFGYPIYEREIDQEIEVELLPGCNMNVRKNLIDGGFDDRFVGYSFREDVDFCYRISRKAKLQMVPDAKLWHHFSSGNRLDAKSLKKMQRKNYDFVARKHKKGFFSRALFYYSLMGLAFIDGVETFFKLISGRSS